LKRDCTEERSGEGNGGANTNTQDGTESGEQSLLDAAKCGEFDDNIHFLFFGAGTATSDEYVECVDNKTAHGTANSVTLNIDTSKVIPKSWILLDNQSTHDVFSNPNLLTDVKCERRSLKIHTQAGRTVTNMKGNLRGYGPVWYCKGGITNILSLAKVQERYRVVFDSKNGNEFVVAKEDGQVRVFKQSRRGLCFMDTAGQSATSTMLVNTVAKNKAKYTNHDYLRALLARRIQKIIGRPSLKTYVRIVEQKRLKNCPVNKDDVIAAQDIFGADVGSLKRKTVRMAQGRVRVALLPFPAVIMDRHKSVTIEADIMKVNGIPFLVSISRAIKFGTVELLANQKMVTVMIAIKNINNLYKRRGFQVDLLLMDGEFESIRGDLAGIGITLNMVSRDEHVSDAERRIRTLKERCRCVFNTLPFTKIPAQMTVQLAYSCNFWLNVFPPEEGVSDLNPRELITGQEIDYEKHCQLEYGTYVQTHDEHDNSMASRTTGAITMRPTGNTQGGYWFYSLNTGRLLNQNHWTSLPMPNEVVARVHQLAKPTALGMQFTDRLNHPYDDEDYEPDDDGNDESLDDSIPGVDRDEIADLNDDADTTNNATNNETMLPDPPTNDSTPEEENNVGADEDVVENDEVGAPDADVNHDDTGDNDFNQQDDDKAPYQDDAIAHEQHEQDPVDEYDEQQEQEPNAEEHDNGDNASEKPINPHLPHSGRLALCI